MARKNAAFSDKIQDMEVGDVIEFSLQDLSRVRVAASLTGLSLGRRYVTRSDPQKGVVSVTRRS